jgi:hypothetical protein
MYSWCCFVLCNLLLRSVLFSLLFLCARSTVWKFLRLSHADYFRRNAGSCIIEDILIIFDDWNKCTLIIYKTSVRTSQRAQYPLCIKMNRWMLCRKIIAACCDSDPERVNTLSGQNAESLMRCMCWPLDVKCFWVTLQVVRWASKMSFLYSWVIKVFVVFVRRLEERQLDIGHV